jgi:hypothetical protein
MKSVLSRGMAPPSLRDSAAVPATSVVSTAFQADVRGGAVPLERPRPICGCLRLHASGAGRGISRARTARRDVHWRRNPAVIGPTLTVAVGQATTVPPARHSTR